MGLCDGVRGQDGGPQRDARASMEPVGPHGAGAAHAVPERVGADETVRTLEPPETGFFLGCEGDAARSDRLVGWPAIAIVRPRGADEAGISVGFQPSSASSRRWPLSSSPPSWMYIEDGSYTPAAQLFE